MPESNYWQTLSQKRLSRRRALEVATAGLGAATLALAGCGGSEENEGGDGGGGTNQDSFLTPTGGEQTPVYGGHLVLATRTIFSGLDIQECVDCWQYAARFHGALYSIDNRTGAFEPQAAESVERPDDLTYIWKLRQGIKFQNVDPVWGRELTAADVVYSVTRRRDDPKVQGRSQLLENYTADFGAPDDYTFRLTTTRPYSPLLDQMSGASIIPKEAVEKWGDLQNHAPGFGAYIMQDFVRGERITWVKNPDFYMKGLPYIDSGELLVIPDESTITKAFETGKTDAYGGSEPNRLKVDRWKDMKGINVRTGPNLWMRAFMLMVDRPPLNDIRVRKALDISIDRDDLIDKMSFGYGRYMGPIVPDMERYALPQDELRRFYKLDVAQARQLLAAAGYENGLDIEIKVMNTADLPKLAQIIAEHLAKAGINLKIVLQELAVWIGEVIGRNFEMTCYYNNPFTEPDVPLCMWFSKGQAGFTFNGYNNPVADEWVWKERSEFDPEKRRQIILDAQRFFITEHGPQIQATSDVGYAAYWNWLHGQDESVNRGSYLNLGVHDWLTEKKV